MVIVGGGVIGTEYASILATMGVPVTLIDKRPRLLEFVDAQIIEALQQQMTDIGVTLCHEEEVVAIQKESDGQVTVSLTHRATDHHHDAHVCHRPHRRDEALEPGGRRHHAGCTRPRDP